jgi:hypothetical protein
VGVWQGRIFSWLGLTLTALFLLGLPVAGSYFGLYAAIVGGGGLIAGGFYLIRQDPT